MSEDTKQQLQIVLDLLRKSLIDNGVSMGLSGNKIMFLIQINMLKQESLMDFRLVLII